MVRSNGERRVGSCIAIVQSHTLSRNTRKEDGEESVELIMSFFDREVCWAGPS